MVKRKESYQTVFKFDQTEAIISDSNIEDGDRVNVFFNDELIEENLELTKEGVAVPLTLEAGANNLVIAARNVGTVDSSNTVKVEFPEELVLIDDGSEFSGDLQPNQVIGREIGLPKIRIDGKQAPFTAQNVRDRLISPTVLSIDRDGSESRRGRNKRAYVAGLGRAKDISS